MKPVGTGEMVWETISPVPTGFLGIRVTKKYIQDIEISYKMDVYQRNNKGTERYLNGRER